MSMREYRSGEAFPGEVGRTFDVSEPAWPEPPRAADDTPNVVYIVLDDTGFGQLGATARRSTRRTWTASPICDRYQPPFPFTGASGR